MDDSNSFDRLVSGLSSNERKAMLDKLKTAGGDSDSSVSDENNSKYEEITFTHQLKNESILFRLFLWLRSLFTNIPAETLYNEHKIDMIARYIDKNSPELIDYKRGILQPSFYSKLNEIKLCAEFFRPYISIIENDENAFIVFLGSLVMPAVEQTMDDEVDPYSIPLSDGPRPEQRMSLLRKMDDVLGDIPQLEKNSMYNAVRAYEWLKQFTKLPFNRFLSLFSTVVESNYTCSFSAIENELSHFARILCNGMKIPKEVFEAVFLFSRRENTGKSIDSLEDVSQKSVEFLEKCGSQISMIKMFISTVPLKLIARIVYADAAWNPDNFTGGEDWYQKYKANWKKLFDQKWEAWSHDCKKEALRSSLTRNFGLEKFPFLPERPWTQLWGGVNFHYELTAGFLNWYIREVFPEFELALKTVMLEGDFVEKDNRQEFNDSFNKLVQLSVDFQQLNRNLSSGGELGMLFQKLMDERLRSIPAHQKIESIIRGVESDIRSMLSGFGDSCRTLEFCFSGIFREKTDNRYDSLTNLNRIGGKNNEKMIESLKKARESLGNAYALIKELEPIDTPSFLK